MFKVKENLNNLYSFENEEAFSRPFITIAREPGSGGVPIASAVAKKLGFECVDEQLIYDIATSTKKRREIIKTVDEKSRGRIEDMVHSMLNPDYIDDVKYITELSKVVLTYAHKGKVVIVGRGANFITPFAKGLHVNITAPYEIRVKRAMDHEGHSREKAVEVIETVEKERKSFVKQYLRKDASKINSYDLTLNTTYFNVNQASDLIIEAFYKKFSKLTRYANIL
jgi:cytidylate kinase